MMFIEIESHFIWKCEGCDHYAAFEPHHFRDCVQELKERGWRFSFSEDDIGRESYGRSWTHYCPSCRRKHQQEQGDWMERRFKPKVVKQTEEK
jgi:hypothetical protein